MLNPATSTTSNQPTRRPMSAYMQQMVDDMQRQESDPVDTFQSKVPTGLEATRALAHLAKNFGRF